GAFLQLYRETARYLDRTAPWVERVGMEFIKARVVDDAESRAALHARFLYSQTFAQDDPWAARTPSAGAVVDKYRTLVAAE
ncbi:MAG: hypothetical protein H7Z10_06445, partial [Gemmatimonadaceae bacterium]|nr:hypothetical protein [Acetobacteraceae bacterium]